MDDKIIRINCEGAAKLKLSELSIIQGDLKSLDDKNYEKLKRHIIKHGFSDAFRIWKGTEKFKGKNCILDGTQRWRVVDRMVTKEGYKIEGDGRLPVDWIKAKDYKEAKQILLGLASQFGRVDKQGLYEFLMDTDLTMQELDDYNFPELKIEKFKMEYFEELQETQVPYITDADKQYIIAIECKDEPEMNKLFSELKKRGLDCKLIV